MDPTHRLKEGVQDGVEPNESKGELSIPTGLITRAQARQVQQALHCKDW